MSVEKYGKGWRYRFDLEPDPLPGWTVPDLVDSWSGRR
jgi:hypothetical protein